MINNKTEAELILSFAGYLQTYKDFRNTSGRILQKEAEAYLAALKPAKCLLGACGRNDVRFYPADYEVIRKAKIACLKMMSNTSVEAFSDLKRMFPEVKLITRLYDDRFGVNHIVSPAEFVSRMAPIIEKLIPYCLDFEVHNEPNHPGKFEGWDSSNASAESFNSWFLSVYYKLKNSFPTASFGFPGLAVPHNDLGWLHTCKEATLRSDWLGCHSYWQNPNFEDKNHLSTNWGLNFLHYHKTFPDKAIHITEAGNSNAQSNLFLDDNLMSKNIIEHFEACKKFPYLGSVSYFILSSPDKAWDSFAFRTEAGRIKKVVSDLAEIDS